MIDSVVAVIDQRIQTTAFNAEQALTKDTVPVNVDAIIFWHAHDAVKAAKQARLILGSAAAAIAGKFVEAANIYAGHPEALQLRAMNIISQTTKERGATILMPSSMVDSMNPYGNTLPLALAGNEVLKPNGVFKGAEPTRSVAAV